MKSPIFDLYYLLSNGKVMRKNIEITRSDNIKIKYKEKEIKSFKDKDGYLCVSLMNNGKQKTYKIHRLIAETFIPNPNNLPCVNHKDGNKQNNCVSNLEWCSYSWNNKHAYANNLKKRKKFSTKKRKIKYVIEEKNFYYNSITEASIKLKCNKGMIIKSIKNNKKYKDGRWYYV